MVLNLIFVLVGLLCVAFLIALCTTANTNDESDIELWLKEHDKQERKKKGK